MIFGFSVVENPYNSSINNLLSFYTVKMQTFEVFIKKRRPNVNFWRGEGLDLALLPSPNAFVGSIASLGCEGAQKTIR